MIDIEILKRVKSRVEYLRNLEEELKEAHEKAISVQSPKYGTTTIHGTSDGAGFTRTSDKYVDLVRDKEDIEMQFLEEEIEITRMLFKMPSRLHEDLLYMFYIRNTPMSEISREFRRDQKQLYKELKKAEDEFRESDQQEEQKGTKQYLIMAERSKVRAERLEDARRRLIKLLASRRKNGKWQQSVAKDEAEKILEGIKKEIQDKKRLYTRIRKQIMKVQNEGYQELLLMRYIDGNTLKEISTYMDITYGSVRHKHINALRTFDKEVMKKEP